MRSRGFPLAAAAAGALLLVLTGQQGAAAPVKEGQSGSVAQPAPAGPPAGPVAALRARSFTIRYRNPGDVAQLIQPALSERGSYTLQPALHTLIVQDAEESLARVADLIRSFDVPPRNVGVTINLLLCSQEPAGQQSLSKEVRGITDVLADITKWKNCKRIDSVSITGSEGAVTSRTLAGEDRSGAYSIELGIQSVDDEHGVIRIDPFTVRKDVHAETTLPKLGSGSASSAKRAEQQPPIWRQVYSTKLNLQPNLLLTLVAARSEKSEEALFLTIRAKVVD